MKQKETNLRKRNKKMVQRHKDVVDTLEEELKIVAKEIRKFCFEKHKAHYTKFVKIDNDGDDFFKVVIQNTKTF